MTLWILAGLAVFGLMVGSFLNVCIGRIPAGESIVTPGSRCPSCRKPIAWYDNVPVLSYLLLGGRCRSCKTRISLRYPIVEIVTSVAFVLQGLALGDAVADHWALLGARLLFTALLITLFGTDLDTMRLPDVLTIPGIVAGLVLSGWLPPGIVASLIGAALGAAIPYVIRWIWFRLKGVEAMGLGDVKMLAMIGAFLGWQQVLVVLFLSSLAGAVIGVSLAAFKGRTLASRLPFGTFLALGAYAASLWGERLVSWYMELYR